MSEFHITPPVVLPVQIRCDDGRRFVGEVFMPAHSARFEGRMLPSEWTGTIPLFFPFRPYESEHRTLLNRRHVVAITVAADANEGTSELAECSPVARVAVDAGGQTFTGQVIIEMPRTHQRPVDLLNGPDPFVTVRESQCHHLIQKDHIVRVVEILED